MPGTTCTTSVTRASRPTPATRPTTNPDAALQSSIALRAVTGGASASPAARAPGGCRRAALGRFSPALARALLGPALPVATAVDLPLPCLLVAFAHAVSVW